MTGEHDKERKAAIAAIEACGWKVVGSTKKGYLYVRCGCGKHQSWFPKTPSNRNTFRNKAADLTAKCCPSRSGA